MPMIQLDRADIETLLRHLEREYLPYEVKVKKQPPDLTAREFNRSE